MFCAFEGPPKVVRLHGAGEVIERGSDGFDELVELFNPSDAYRPLLRSFVRIEVSRISDSCGFVVPRMDFVAERDQLPKWAVNKQETSAIPGKPTTSPRTTSKASTASPD